MCGCKVPLAEQPRTNLTYDELPDTLRTLYKLSMKNNFMDSLQDKLGPKKYPIINLDRDVKKAEFEIDWMGPWIDEFIFEIDDHTLTLDFNGNTINDPYILLDKDIYFVRTMNPSIKGIEKAEFGKFDLRGVLE